MDIKNKKALITGSTDGLGKVLALKLAELGYNIYLHGRNNISDALAKPRPTAGVNRKLQYNYN